MPTGAVYVYSYIQCGRSCFVYFMEFVILDVDINRIPIGNKVFISKVRAASR